MSAIIIFKNKDGSCGVIYPTPEWQGTLEELAAKDVPYEIVGFEQDGVTPVFGDQLPWRVTDVDALPASRNYRNAWTDNQPTTTVDIDLERAKPLQRQLMIGKMFERIEKDEFNRQDTATTEAEINAIDVGGAASLTELYNMWPSSIENRKGKREYKERK